MAKQYRVDSQVRMINKLVGGFTRLGFMDGTYTLTTTGRKSGQPRSTPVTLATVDGTRYLVAPYGEVGWVHNVRANPAASLKRRGADETIRVSEVGADEAGPILKQYVEDVKIVRPYFDATPDSAVAAFVAEAARHPVFRIED
jgi:deazaflavin-dependent oxidoreductase (nitroreductase family)